MRNTGILLFLAGIYIVINSGSLRDLVFGKAHISFLNPKSGEPKINDQGGVGDKPYGPPTPSKNEATYG